MYAYALPRKAFKIKKEKLKRDFFLVCCIFEMSKVLP